MNTIESTSLNILHDAFCELSQNGDGRYYVTVRTKKNHAEGDGYVIHEGQSLFVAASFKLAAVRFALNCAPCTAETLVEDTFQQIHKTTDTICTKISDALKAL